MKIIKSITLYLMLGLLQSSCSFLFEEEEHPKQVITAPYTQYGTDVQNQKGTLMVDVTAWVYKPTSVSDPPRERLVLKEGQTKILYGIQLIYWKGRMILTSKKMGKKRKVILHAPGEYDIDIEIKPSGFHWTCKKKNYEPFEGIVHPSSSED